MKKSLFCLLGVIFIFFSCEKNEFMVEELDTSVSPQTRSASDDIPDPLAQMSGFMLHIKNVATGKYLSGTTGDNSVVLYDQDDGSYRQRWYLLPNGLRICIVLAGGSGYQGCHVSERDYYPYMRHTYSEPNRNGGLQLEYIPNTQYYYIKTPFHPPHPGTYPDFDSFNHFMQPYDGNSNNLLFTNNKYKGDLTKWQFIPVDEFNILEISYKLSSGDNLVVAPKVVQTKTLVNNTDEPATRTITLSEAVSNESTFSQTEKMSVSIRQDASVKFGIAEFVEGNLSVGSTSSSEWSYTVGQKEVHTTTITESISQIVPPRTTITAKLVASEYKAKLTYIAKLLGINTNKTIYLKGKWDGIVVQDTRIELYYPDGKLLKTINIIPK